MKRIAMLLGTCMVFGGLSSAETVGEATPVPKPSADAKVYGENPLGYKQIITYWLQTKLADPASAVIEFPAAPKPGEYKTQKGETYVGYIVDFKVNARNQFGAPTGKQRYRVVIRNGDVVWGGRPRY